MHRSRIVLGCANFGSFLSSSQIREIVTAALAQGIRSFDVAPTYGEGRAEAALSLALGKSQSDVMITSKFGYAAPVVSLGPIKEVFGRLPVLVRLLRRGRSLLSARQKSGHSAIRRSSIDGASLRQCLTGSLRRLRRDSLDLFLLHGVRAEEISEDLIASLEAAVSDGLVREIGLATDPDEWNKTYSRSSLLQVVQMRESPDARNVERVAPGSARTVVTHSIFGRDGLMRRRLAARLGADTKFANRVQQVVHRRKEDPGFVVDLLLHYALASNPGGRVICGVSQASQIGDLVACADRHSDAVGRVVLQAVRDLRM